MAQARMLWWMAGLGVISAVWGSSAVYAQVSTSAVQISPSPSSAATITFKPDANMPFKHGADQYYYMAATTEGICKDHRYTGDMTFENTEFFGSRHLSDNYITGETRSVPATGAAVYIHAGILAPYEKCENGAQFSPLPNHDYEIIQRYKLGAGPFRCGLSVIDKGTNDAPPDLTFVNYCKWK